MRRFALLACLLASQAVSGLEYDGAYLSNSLKDQLNAWQESQRRVTGVYLFGSQWIAHAGSEVVCSGGAITALCDRFKNLAAGGNPIFDYAEDANGRSIIVSRNGVDYSDPGHFRAIGVAAAIDRLRALNAPVNSVALFENDGWMVIAQGRVESKNLPPKLAQALEEARWGQHHIRSVFSRFPKPTESEWILLAGGDFWTNRTHEKLQDALFGFTRKQRYFGPVAFENSRYVAVSNNRRIPTSNFDRLEYGLWSGGQSHSLLDRMEHHRVPGVSISIILGDEILTRTYGVLNHSSQQKATSTSYFPAASLSKAVFSYGMMKAHESGVLDLDQTLAQFATRHPEGLVRTWYDSLPDTEEKPYRDRAARTTLRSLLSHTGGMSVHGIGSYNKSSMRSLSDLIMGTRGRRKVEPIDEPNTHYRYSGGGYSLVEAALEDVTGVPAGDWLALNVLGPLNMERSTFNQLHPTREVEFARGHTKDLRTLAVRYCPGKGAGGLTTTSRAYAGFLWSVMNSANVQGEMHPYISRRSHRDFFTPAVSPASSGDRCEVSWQCDRRGEHCIFGRCLDPLPSHTGSTMKHYSPGQNHTWQRVSVPRHGVAFEYPRESFHGGAQYGVRSRFFYSYETRMGMVVMTNGEHEWEDEDKVRRGADTLIDEIRVAFFARFR